MTTRGAGVGYVGGCVPVQGGIVLSVARMNRILEINPADGVAVVQPGRDHRRPAGRRPRSAAGATRPTRPRSRSRSIGGNIATNAGGPRCLKYGVTRNYVLGLEVVLADGRVLRTGGRVHKNKTGFDLTALFVGSEGMLGVITEATLRLIPRPAGPRDAGRRVPDLRSRPPARCRRSSTAATCPRRSRSPTSFTLRAARARLGADALPRGQGAT